MVNLPYRCLEGGNYVAVSVVICTEVSPVSGLIATFLSSHDAVSPAVN